MSWIYGMKNDDTANLNKVIDGLHPNKYVCKMKYKEINVGDVVELEKCTQVRITHNKHSYGINEFVLEIHFEKVEG